MDTKQLSTFITLAETLNYQRAAERLQYAPSSLFRHVQLLEEELGASLFFKNGRQLELTEDGRRLLPEAQRLLAGWQTFLGHAQESESARAIAVGGCEMNTAYSLVGLLQRYAAQYPDARYSMTTSPNVAVPELLRASLIDLGFLYGQSPRQPKGLSLIPLYSEPLYPCCAPGNPLRGRKGLRWADLAGLDIAHPHDNCCFVTGFQEALEARGLSMGRASFLGGISLVIEHARRENALLLIPYHALPRMQADFDVLPLDLAEEPLHFWESVIYRSAEDLLPGARRLIRAAVRFADAEVAAHPDTLLGPASHEPYLAQL